MQQGNHQSIIFINYRRADAGWPADHLAEKLKTVFGKNRIFLDVRGIQAGDDFAVEIENQLRQTTIFIVLIGEKWLYIHDQFGRRRLDHNDDWVRKEIRYALQKEDCKVIPVLLDDASLPNESGALPDEISEILNLQRIRIRQTNSEDDINALINKLKEMGFRSYLDANIQIPQAEDTRINLTKSKEEVDKELRHQIEIGKILLGELRKSPPSTREDLDKYSRYWHSWRRYSEQILTFSFSSPEPFQWLKALTPKHLKFGESIQYRSRNLLEDIDQEIAFLENLVVRLDNYDETQY